MKLYSVETKTGEMAPVYYVVADSVRQATDIIEEYVKDAILVAVRDNTTITKVSEYNVLGEVVGIPWGDYTEEVPKVLKKVATKKKTVKKTTKKKTSKRDVELD